MPTLPLYRTDAAPDAWHEVKAPGGYEWWRFEAFDAKSNRRVAFDLFDGDPFNPTYLERHQAYLDRPTKNPPPTSSEFPTINVAVYDGETPTSRHVFQYPTGSLVGRPDSVALGPNQLHGLGGSAYSPPLPPGEGGGEGERSECDHLEIHPHPDPLPAGEGKLGSGADGSITLHLSLPAKTVASVALTLKPVGVVNAHEISLLPPDAGFGVHRWFAPAAAWEVSGSIKDRAFTGVGFYDHGFGNRPLATSLTALLRGWIRTEDGAAVAFAAMQPFDSDQCTGWLSENGRWTQVNAAGLSMPFSKIGYAQPIALGDDLTLQKASVLASEPARLRLIYSANWRGREVQANCELALPRRWKWPTIGMLTRTPITMVGSSNT